MDDQKKLVVPSLRGEIGDWVYYSAIIPFGELKRVQTIHQIKESRDLDEALQRDLHARVESIKNYLLIEEERFFSSIIVGVYGDIPDWYSLDLSIIEEKFNLDISDSVQESLGVLTLSGEETLFTIDGQHRVEAVNLAIEQDCERFLHDSLSVIFIGHADDEKHRIRTRKLFATINRMAEKPSANDLAIIDETFAYNIVARMLYSRYTPFQDLIALTPQRDLKRDDHKHFTNLLSLVAVNKEILKLVGYRSTKNTTSSPSESEREEYYQFMVEFWDFIIGEIKLFSEFFHGQLELQKVRNKQKGEPHNLLFTPIGIQLVTNLYRDLYKAGQLSLFSKINKINFFLNEGEFKNVYFNPIKNKMETKNKSLGLSLLKHLIGFDDNLDRDELRTKLAESYGISTDSTAFNSFSLPGPV